MIDKIKLAKMIFECARQCSSMWSLQMGVSLTSDQLKGLTGAIFGTIMPLRPYGAIFSAGEMAEAVSGLNMDELS